MDSQNRSGDPYVALTIAATVTERIGLAPRAALDTAVERAVQLAKLPAKAYAQNKRDIRRTAIEAMEVAQ